MPVRSHRCASDAEPSAIGSRKWWSNRGRAVTVEQGWSTYTRVMRWMRSLWDKLRWDAVFFVGALASAVLLIASDRAYQPVQNFLSCNPPPLGRVVVQPSQVYVCPVRYEHSWSVHNHAELAVILLIAAVFAALATGTALCMLVSRSRAVSVSSNT